MNLVVRQAVGAGRVQPVELTCYPGSRLIVMRNGFPLSKLLLNLLVDPIYLFCSRLTSFHHCAFTDRLAVQIRKNLGHPLQ